MSAATVISGNSKAQDSRVFLTNLGGQFAKVASATTTTVTVDSSDGVTGKSLFSAGNPGLLVIASSAAGAANQGMTALITAVAGNVYTVDVDFATGGELADGDVVALIPPLAVELFLNGGHTLSVTSNDDETKGLTETFLTHNTRLNTEVGGDIPFFQTVDSEGFGRLLLAGIGAEKVTSTLHEYVGQKDNDGTYTDADDFCVYSIDGNGTVEQVFFSLFGTQLTLDFPETGIATGSLSSLGAGVVREVGGTGRTIPAGYIPSGLDCDTGPRFTFQRVFLEIGGTFGNAVSDSYDQFVKNATVTISRGAVTDSVLGNQYIVKPIEDMFDVTITGTRILENDTYVEAKYGGANAAEPGVSTEDRVVLEAIGADPARILRIDLPNAKIKTRINRQRGRITEDFTITGVHLLDADGCLDLTNPLVLVSLDNNDATIYASAL